MGNGRKLTYAQLLTWIDEGPSRRDHHDIELLRWLGGRAKEISIMPPTAATAGLAPGVGYSAIELVMSDLRESGLNDDFVYWNEWDSFSGWAGICDILWAELQPHVNKKVKVSKSKGGNGKKRAATKKPARRTQR